MSNGKYTIVIVGGTLGDVSVEQSNLRNLSESFLGFNEPPSDTFFKKFSLDLNNQDHQEAISLSRIIGKLQIVIEDPIPTEVHKIEMDLMNEIHFFSFDTEAVLNPSGSSMPQWNLTKTITSAEKGKSNYTFGRHVITTGHPMIVNLKAYNDAGKLVFSKKIEKVVCEKNATTTLRGKLFDRRLNSMDSEVTVDAAWGAGTDVDF